MKIPAKRLRHFSSFKTVLVPLRNWCQRHTIHDKVLDYKFRAFLSEYFSKNNIVASKFRHWPNKQKQNNKIDRIVNYSDCNSVFFCIKHFLRITKMRVWSFDVVDLWIYLSEGLCTQTANQPTLTIFISHWTNLTSILRALGLRAKPEDGAFKSHAPV